MTGLPLLRLRIGSLTSLSSSQNLSSDAPALSGNTATTNGAAGSEASIPKVHLRIDTSNREENNYTYEEQFILRLPEQIAVILHSNANAAVDSVNVGSVGISAEELDGAASEFLVEGDASSRSDLLSSGHAVDASKTPNADISGDCISITFTSKRVAQVLVRLDQGPVDSIVEARYALLVGVLLDLPTIIESQRTFDRSLYCKIADISQMLLCQSLGMDGQSSSLAECEAIMGKGMTRSAAASHFEGHSKVKEIISYWRDQRHWQMSDGLTPPMADVRRRRFAPASGRRNVLGRHRQVESIEAKVQELIERDAAAEHVRFVLYASDGSILKQSGATGSESVLGDEEDDEDETESQFTMEEDRSTTVAANEEEEEDDDADFAAELEDEMMMAVDDHHTVQQPQQSALSSAIPDAKDAPEMNAASIALSAKIQERKQQLATVTNPLIRARLEEVIRSLEGDLEQRSKDSS